MSYIVSECKNSKYFISWGLGVQSTCLIVMSALKTIKKVDGIITADTGWEHKYSYEIRDFYIRWLKDKGIPVYIVSSGNIKLDENKEHCQLPLWTSKSGAPLRRQCTSHYKIFPIRRKIREILGLRLDNKGRTLRNSAIIYLGISIDEAERMSQSDRAWIKNEYPLIDLGMSRANCIEFFNDHDLPVPMKSSCICCPYQGAEKWLYLKRNYPEDWKEVCTFDNKLREPSNRMKLKGYDFDMFLWKKLTSLETTDFKRLLQEKDNKDICDSGYCFI